MKLPNVRLLKAGTPFGGLGYYKPLKENDWYFDDPQVPEDDQALERRCRVPFYLTDTIAALGVLHKLCGDDMKCGDLPGAYFEIRGPRGYLVTIYTPARDFSATGGSLASAIRRVALLTIGIEEPIGG